MIKRLLLAALLLATLAVAAVAGFALFAYSSLDRPHGGWEGSHVDVLIEPGTPASAMVRQLAAAGVLARPRWVKSWLSLSGDGARLQAGEYRFERPASAREVIDRLRRGDVLLHAVTIPEGLDLVEVAQRLAAAGFADEASLLAAFRDPTPIRDLDPRSENLEGYLFPDTYHFPRGIDAASVTGALVERFKEAVGDDFAARAGEVGLELREAVALASLIEKETSVAGERPRISRVFHNRLERGMKLQCDPTVIYALKQAGREVGRLTYDDLEIESPWNTYFIRGLPVGPIANPGKASLLAAVQPSEGPELYFVASPDGDGGHVFSNTLAAHRRAVTRWRAYLRSSR